ncbi:tape measure protein [Aminobacter sp. AP02]|uniref:tape measure protein n=1 Tax=Aminobacter sp. AP02 TaxID=2135737 RepID=UPI000D6B40FB|nr:tape measure protein [Aminobacter sp. AP02]PWK65875.1 lambda family phage tail tape measure protein [Aminobacter sp. AP02]
MATDLERLVVQLSADFKSFEKGLARAQGVSNRQFSAIEARARKLNTNLDSIGRQAANSLIAPLSGIGAALGVREIARYADTWTEAGNKIRAAAQIAGVSTRSLDVLKDSANAARADFSTYVDLYAKLIRSASGVAKSELEVATATDVVTRAFKAGGASTQEQIAGIMQLSQALGSGVLQGDELRSLRENAPLLAKAIADEFKTTIAGLKDLGAEGKLTSERVFKAILAAQKPIGAAFAVTNATIQDAISRINNEFTAYIGNADASAGASRKLVEALQYLADNFGAVSDTVLQFATVLISALTGRAILGVVAGLGNAVVALGAFLTAMRAGTLVATGFTAALGPIGLLAGAAAAAIFLLSDSQAEAKGAAGSFQISIKDNEAALRSATDATHAQVDALRQLIAMQVQAAKTAAIDAEAQYNVANNRSKSFKKATGLEFEPFEYSTRNAGQKLADLQAAQFQLEDQLAAADKLLATKPSGFGIGSGTLPDKDKKSKSRKKTAQNRLDEDIQAIRDRTAALLQEQELVGKSFYVQEKRRVALDLEQSALKELREEARKKGATDLESITLSNAQVAAIDAASEAYARQADALRRVEETQERIEQAASDAYEAFKSGAMDAILGADSLQDALSGVLKRLAEIAISSAFDGLFKPATGGSSGGAFGGVFSAIGKFLGFAEGGYTGDGGKNTPAGTVHKGEYVFSKAAVQKAGVANLDSMHRNLKSGYASGGYVGAPVMPRIQTPANQNAAAQFTFAPQIDARGASVEAVARLEQVVARQQREFSANVVNTVRKMRPANMKV